MADSNIPDVRMIQVNPIGKQGIHYYLCMLDLPFEPDPTQFVLLNTTDDLNNINYYYHGSFDSPAGTPTTTAMPLFYFQYTDNPDSRQAYNITGVTIKDQNGTVKKGDMSKGVIVNDDLSPDETMPLYYMRPFVIQSYTNTNNYFVCAVAKVHGEGVNSPLASFSPTLGTTDLSFNSTAQGANQGSNPPPTYIAEMACLPSTLNQYTNILPITGSTNQPTSLADAYANPTSDYNPLAGSAISQ